MVCPWKITKIKADILHFNVIAILSFQIQHVGDQSPKNKIESQSSLHPEPRINGANNDRTLRQIHKPMDR